MDKICLIYQPCGLGDILFIQKIAKHWYNKGYDVIIPVVYELEWLNQYIDNVKFISWDDKDKLTHMDKLSEHVKFPYKDRYNPYADSVITDDFVYLNLFTTPRGRVMEYKYTIANLDYSDWSKYLTFNRNINKENELFYDNLGLNDNEEYVFISRIYQTRPNPMYYNRISTDSKNYEGKRVVELSIIGGYSMFDWLKVVEGACEIHMIESAMCYALETNQVKLNATIMNLYSRINNFSEVDYLFKMPWNYVK